MLLRSLLLLCSVSSFVAAAAPLQWQESAGFRVAALSVAPSTKAGFTALEATATGLTFTNVIPVERHLTNQILLNGSGVAAGDVDGDGRADLYFCRLSGPNALYRNLGNWRFEEIAETAGVANVCPLATGCALLDLDGDRDLDLIVNSVGQGTHIFYNEGKGRFTRRREFLNAGNGGMSIAAGDLNGDGFLDLYIANYRTLGLMDIPNARATFKKLDGRTVVETFDGKPATHPDVTNRFTIGPRGSFDEHGQADLILLSDKGTDFSRLPFASGMFLDEDGQPLRQELFDWGLSAMIRDTNGDGLPDIYVCNDFQSPDRFWINQGGGKFRLAPRLALRKSSLFSMAVDFADVNRDGFDDLFVVDMLSRSHAQRMKDLPDNTPPLYSVGRFDDRPQYSLNSLFVNRGDDTFSEISQLAGVQASDWSWSCVFVDVDLDGWEDILISNGMERGARDLDVAEKLKQMRATRRMTDAQIFEARKMFPRLATANVAFRNERNGKFRECGKEWNFASEGVSNGMALADLDNDGDLDVVVNNLNASAGLYRNETAAPRVAVKLRGLPPNTAGIGARITLRAENLPPQSQEMIAAGRYLSSDDAIRVFAVAGATNLTLEVRWPNGRRSELASVRPDSVYEIDEKESRQLERPAPTAEKPWFEDLSERIPFTHFEPEFDDYTRQPMLSKKLSQLGPGVAWIDLDRDGWDDLVIGSGKGGRLGVFQNHQGEFKPHTIAGAALPRDVLGLAAAPSTAGQVQVLMVMANYEEGLRTGAAVRSTEFPSGLTRDVVSASESSPGPLALADIDGDGDLDLFVGGRVIAANYPVPASSRIFLQENGSFSLDQPNAEILAQAGLVSGALFSDIDADNDADLVLACEWGPLRILLNEKGRFHDRTVQFGLARYTGKWNSVAAGDFDGDGRMDLVAGNWGQNTPYERFRSKPLRCYYGDVDSDGTLDVFEAHWDTDLGKYVIEKQLASLVKAVPSLQSRFKSNAEYSTAGIEEILGARIKAVKMHEAAWLESSVFLNRGDHFAVTALPLEAQFAPVFGIGVADFDGDRKQDIFLAQNFFAVPPEIPRYDGGRGLLLRGNGEGGFAVVPGQISGIAIYGEQRGSAVADFDRDGRPDLCVAQNGAALKLYRNTKGNPGVRVTLEGSARNRAGVGARLRFVSPNYSGPMHEIHAGSGYLSQDSFNTIIHPRGSGEVHLWWPDGHKSTVPITSEMRDLRIPRD